MTTLSFGHSDTEDRLWITLPNGGPQLWLTRRLISLLLRHLVEQLTATCPGGDIVGSLQDVHRVALEHETANETEGDAASPPHEPELPLKQARRVHLITTMHLTVGPSAIEIELLAAGFHHSLKLQRAEAHRLAGVLYRRAQAADWAIQGMPVWLQRTS
ncbi:MAG TPA: hypothetical protein VIT92_15165 [Burkholderiaceae bacterium]